jgi:hypothetical protein
MEISLVVIIVLVVLAVVGSRYLQSRTDTRQRKLRYDERGDLVAIEEVAGQQPIHLAGEGSHTTKPLQLQAGTYKLRYRFPTDVLGKVDLWHEGDSETVVLKRSQGEASFTVADDGRYTFEIAPADEQAPWELDIMRLGLPSGMKPPDIL